MKELSGIRSNTTYLKKKDGSYQPHIELIIVVSEPQYEMTNTGEVAQQRESESLRFASDAKGMFYLRHYIDAVLEDLDEDGEINLAEIKAKLDELKDE